MPNVRRDDYDIIVNIFNESGIKIAMEYIEQNFGVKYPRDVLTRIKKYDRYSYIPGINILTERSFMLSNVIAINARIHGIAGSL